MVKSKLLLNGRKEQRAPAIPTLPHAPEIAPGPALLKCAKELSLLFRRDAKSEKVAFPSLSLSLSLSLSSIYFLNWSRAA